MSYLSANKYNNSNNGSSGSGVQSVTGNLVNNLDPLNPIINCPATANVWFVAENGNDLNTPNSILKPFLTLAQAQIVAQPGDTIALWTGTYTANLFLLPSVAYTAINPSTTIINGNISCNTAGNYFFENINVENDSASWLSITGSDQINVYLKNVGATLSSGSAGIGIDNDNVDSSVIFRDCDITQANTVDYFILDTTNGAGNVIFENTNLISEDNINNVAFNLAGGTNVLLSRGSNLYGKTSLTGAGSLAVTQGSSLTTDNVDVINHVGTGVVVLDSMTINTTANATITGTGTVKQSNVTFGNTGFGIDPTVNGGDGAEPLLQTAFALQPDELTESLYDGQVEYDGTDYYITANGERSTVVLNKAQVNYTPLPSGTITLTSGFGKFTQIGKTVFLVATIVFPTNSDTTPCTLTGFPVGLEAVGGFQFPINVVAAPLPMPPSNTVPVAVLQNGTISFFAQDTYAALTNENMSEVNLILSITYTVA